MKKKLVVLTAFLLAAIAVTSSIPNVAKAINTEGNPSEDYGIGFIYEEKVVDGDLEIVHNFEEESNLYLDFTLNNPESIDVSNGTYGIDAGSYGFISYSSEYNDYVSLFISNYGDYTLSFTFEDSYGDSLSYFQKIKVVKETLNYNTKLSKDKVSIDINNEIDSYYFDLLEANENNAYILSYDNELLDIVEDNYRYTITPKKISNSNVYINEIDNKMNLVNQYVVNVDIYALNSFFDLFFDMQYDGSCFISYKLSEDIYSYNIFDIFINVNGIDISSYAGEGLLIKDFKNKEYIIYGSVYDNLNNLIIESKKYYFKEGVEFVPEIETDISVDIIFTKDSEGSFTIFDDIEIKARVINYTLKENDDVNWYIDDELIDVEELYFVHKFLGAREYEIAFEIISEGESILTCKKNILIKEDKNAQMSLSISKSNVLACVEGDIFTLSALLDKMLFSEFEYSWIIEDNDILSFYVDPSGSNTAVLKPLKEGVTKVYVSCDFNKGVEATKLVSVEVEVIGKIETLSLETSSTSNKPNNPIYVSLIVNGKKDVCNLSPSWDVTYNDEKMEYEVVDESTIKINSSSTGKVNVSASYKEKSTSVSVKFENIPVEQILKNSLPFVLLITLVALLIVFGVSKRKNPLYKLIDDVKNINDELENSIKYIKTHCDDKKIKKYIKKTYRKTLNLSISAVALANYLALEKSSDLINVLKSIKTLKSQLTIANKVGVKKLDVKCNLLVLKKILKVNVKPIYEEIKEISVILNNFDLKVAESVATYKRSKKEYDFSSKAKYEKFVNDALTLADDSNDDGD